jgi:hypothetical protein
MAMSEIGDGSYNVGSEMEVANTDAFQFIWSDGRLRSIRARAW